MHFNGLGFNPFSGSELRAYCFILDVTSLSTVSSVAAGKSFNSSLTSIQVLLAPGTIKSSQAHTQVLLLLAQVCQSFRVPDKAHSGVVYDVTIRHCCKLLPS